MYKNKRLIRRAADNLSGAALASVGAMAQLAGGSVVLLAGVFALEILGFSLGPVLILILIALQWAGWMMGDGRFPGTGTTIFTVITWPTFSSVGLAESPAVSAAAAAGSSQVRVRRPGRRPLR